MYEKVVIVSCLRFIILFYFGVNNYGNLVVLRRMNERDIQEVPSLIIFNYQE